MPHVSHVEWPAGDADRLQAFLEGLFGWQFDSPMPEMDYRMARAAENEGAAVYPSEERGLLAYYDYPISTGPLEGTNNKIKTMKRQAYGFRDREFFKLKILAIHESRYEMVG